MALPSSLGIFWLIAGLIRVVLSRVVIARVPERAGSYPLLQFFYI